jgi:hypothetical protein
LTSQQHLTPSIWICSNYLWKESKSLKNSLK